MTPAPGDTRQQEYIITEEQVEQVFHFFHIPEDSMDEADYMMQDDLLKAIRSRPAASQPIPEHVRLNTQPEGCDCGDCERYGANECPYPGSNPTMILCNSFLLNIKQHDAAIRNEVLDDICKNCGAKECGACVGIDCPVGSYKSTTSTTADKGGE